MDDEVLLTQKLRSVLMKATRVDGATRLMTALMGAMVLLQLAMLLAILTK